jgi:hypothetical protein
MDHLSTSKICWHTSFTRVKAWNEPSTFQPRTKLTSLIPNSRPQCCGAMWPNYTNNEDDKQAIKLTTVNYHYYHYHQHINMSGSYRKCRDTRVHPDLPKTTITSIINKSMRADHTGSAGTHGCTRSCRRPPTAGTQDEASRQGGSRGDPGEQPKTT